MSGNDKDKDKKNETKQKEIDPQKEYICDQCEYKTSSKWRLARHCLTHTGEKPFTCPYMTWDKYSSIQCKGQLCIRLEPGDALLPGYTRCLSSFRYSDQLRNHIRTHTGETPFKCTVSGCGLAFSLLKELNQHLKTHTTEELEQQQQHYQCTICQKSFVRQENLVSHLALHASKSKHPFICLVPKCGLKFDCRRELVAHRKLVHDSSADLQGPSAQQNECGKSTEPVSPPKVDDEAGGSSSDSEEIPCSSRNLPPKKRYRRK